MTHETQTRRIYVGGLSSLTTEDKLREVFSKFGSIELIDFKQNPFNGRNHAIITLESHEAAEAAVAKDEMTLDNRFIRIDFFRDRKDNSFRNRRRRFFEEPDDIEFTKEEKKKSHKHHHKKSKRRHDSSESDSDISEPSSKKTKESKKSKKTKKHKKHHRKHSSSSSSSSSSSD